MGSGIAQVCAAAGYKTIVREVDDILLNKGIGRIRKFLDDGVAKGKATADARDKTLANLTALSGAAVSPLQALQAPLLLLWRTGRSGVALGLLVQTLNKCKGRHQRLKLAGAQPQIRKVLTLTRLDQVFDLADSVESAVE